MKSRVRWKRLATGLAAIAPVLALVVVPAALSESTPSAAEPPAIIRITDPAWSPTRPEIAFIATLADGSSDVFVAAPDGSRLRRLEQPDLKPGFSPVWSPDGNSLALTRFDGRADVVIVAGRDGSRPPTQVSFGQVNRGSWAPDSRRLAFDAESPVADGLGLGIADLGRNTVRILHLHGYRPAWSPRHDVIAYSVMRCARSCRDVWSVTYVVDPQGRNRRRLFRGENAAWSSDGKLLAFTTPKGISIAGSDGRGRRLVLRSSLSAVAEQTQPIWAPHRRLVAVVVEKARSARSGVFVIDVGRNRVRRLPGVSVVTAGKPAWSPDGRRLVFAGGSRLYVVGADGKGGHFVVPTWG